MNHMMRIPGPDHPITIEPARERIRVLADGQVIAETTAALKLQESSYPPVDYIPRADVDMAQLRRTDHTTYCPYKGHCSYFSIPAAGASGENAVWSYEEPYEAMAAIRGALAFYPDRVEIARDREQG